MRQNKSEACRLGEELTVYYLKKRGYEILRRNYRVKGGEIDVIAARNGIIAFIEVKTRDLSALQTAAESVGGRKRTLIVRAAQEYSYRYPHSMQPRFDISQITVKNGRILKFRYFDDAYRAGEDLTL